MKILALADLHLDFYFGQRMNPFENVPEEQFDGITHCVLAGDLSNKGHKQWKRCLPWLAERLPHAKIFVMPGNHDYYDGAIDREEKLRDVASDHGAAFIQKSELICGRQRFLCCTLWTDFAVYGDRADNIRNAASHMNDYRLIRVAKSGHKRLVPAQTAQIHLDHRDWLDERLSKIFDGETTVITHHAPHVNALKGTPSTGPCYASNLEDIILKHQPERWLFGHTHHPVSFNVGRTVLTNVSIGYPGQIYPIDSLERFISDLEK
jgi:predicted MPP superfamily phosphohydrolase